MYEQRRQCGMNERKRERERGERRERENMHSPLSMRKASGREVITDDPSPVFTRGGPMQHWQFHRPSLIHPAIPSPSFSLPTGVKRVRRQRWVNEKGSWTREGTLEGGSVRWTWYVLLEMTFGQVGSRGPSVGWCPWKSFKDVIKFLHDKVIYRHDGSSGNDRLVGHTW